MNLAVALTSGLCVQARGRQWSLDIHSGVCGWQRAYVRSTSGRGLKTWQSHIQEPTRAYNNTFGGGEIPCGEPHLDRPEQSTTMKQYVDLTA